MIYLWTYTDILRFPPRRNMPNSKYIANSLSFSSFYNLSITRGWCRDKKNKNDVDAGFLLDENGQKIELPVNMFQIGSPVTMTVLQMALTQEQYDLFMLRSNCPNYSLLETRHTLRNQHLSLYQLYLCDP